MFWIIGWILFGAIVGAIAKFLMPGRDPAGCLVTIALGVAGSLTGGFLLSFLISRRGDHPAGWVGSIVGAMLLLWVYRMVAKPRR